MPVDESYDEGLFPTKADHDEAKAAWSAGNEAIERGKPTGKFQAEITIAELGRSAASDRLQIHYGLRIMAGPSKDEEIHKYDGCETEQQMEMTQQQLKRLGVDTASISFPEAMPAILLVLVGRVVAITCKQNNDFYNIYFDRLLSEDVSVPKASQGTQATPVTTAKRQARRPTRNIF